MLSLERLTYDVNILLIALEICEEYAADAGYEDLLQKLYKEMMMMGFLSFGLFIAFNAFGVKVKIIYFQ